MDLLRELINVSEATEKELIDQFEDWDDKQLKQAAEMGNEEAGRELSRRAKFGTRNYDKPGQKPFMEATIDAFKQMTEIKFDPDRTDPADIFIEMRKIIAQVAYTFLVHEKQQHDKRQAHDEDEDKTEFNFSFDALADECQDVWRQVKTFADDRMNSHSDWLEYIHDGTFLDLPKDPPLSGFAGKKKSK